MSTTNSDSDTDCERSEADALLLSSTPPELSLCNLVRWLLIPSLFIVGHWCLLFAPVDVLKISPTLWKPAVRSPDAFMLPTPKTRVQVFDLGAQFHRFDEHCKDFKEDSLSDSAVCKNVLKKAADILGAESPLTAKQLLGERAILAELDEQRSVMDKVAGFFSFVNILWLIGIMGILCTMGPCIGVIIGPMLKEYALALYERILRPTAIFLHELGFWELFAYVLAFLLSVQGARYPSGADAGIMVSLTGGLLFVPCWIYSTSLHVPPSGDKKDKWMTLSHFLVAVLLAPLALIHHSTLLGFLAVLAVYGGLGFIFLAFGFGFLIGFNSQDAINNCILASVVLIVTFTCFRVLGRNPACVQPFVLGGMCLGNIMYFLGLLIASNRWRRTYPDWWKMQILMALSLFFALLVGFVYSIPAMANTACTFLVLWLMEKQLEVNWGAYGSVIIFFNCVGLFMVSLWLNHHPEFIISMFDGKGLYS